MRKKLSVFFVVLCFFSASIFAQIPNHKNIIPKSRGFSWQSLYVELDGAVSPPIVFTGASDTVDLGGGGGIEFGYDWDGWLFGVRYNFLSYVGSGDSLMKIFNHNIANVCVSRSFGGDLISFFPNWLELCTKLSVAWDFAYAEYFVNNDAKLDNVKTCKNDSAFFYSAALFFDFNLPYVWLFAGPQFGFTHDEGGFYFMPEFSAGVRLNFGKLASKKGGSK